MHTSTCSDEAVTVAGLVVGLLGMGEGVVVTMLATGLVTSVGLGVSLLIWGEGMMHKHTHTLS